MYSRILRNATVTLVAIALISTSFAQEAPKKAEPKKPEAKPEPPKAKLVMDMAKEAKLTTFCELVEKAGLTETFNGKDVTVLAPTNEAFDKLGKDKLAELQKPEKKAELAKILKNHIIAGVKAAADIEKAKDLETMAGEKLAVVVKDKVVTIGAAKVVKADTKAGNGMLHTIDAVNMPK
jgi:uncharacterized surface protein with fasciclin (FAS1) repeats